MSKLHIKKGDTVYVNTGSDRKKTGTVLKVLVKENKAIVEGINIKTKSVKPSAKYPQGGIVKEEAPIHISNLSHILPSTLGNENPVRTRIGCRKNAEGKTVRYCKKNDGKEVID